MVGRRRDDGLDPRDDEAVEKLRDDGAARGAKPEVVAPSESLNDAKCR